MTAGDEMTKPAWLERLEFYEAQGFAEIPGPKSNPKIVAWMQGPGGGKWVKGDDTPWCGGGMAGMLSECGLADYIPKDPLAAINWLNLPTKLDEPRVGAIVVFKRPGGHHVTCIKSFDERYLYCIGPNQGDAIKTSRFARTGPNKPLGYRWPVPLVTSKELAGTSRIAASAEQQKRDQAVGTGILSTSPAPEVAPPAPPGWRESVDAWLGEVSWVKTLFNYGADFGGFVGAHWPYIAVTVAAFFFGRSWWNSHKIAKARVEDANMGWTT